jgi:hypothetical protein
MESFNNCVKCGADKTNAPECPACGVIYSKAEDAFKARAEQVEENADPGYADIVAFHYVDAAGDATFREVSRAIRYSMDGRWYIRGHCHLRDDDRTFRIDRIKGDIIDVQTGKAIDQERILLVSPPDDIFEKKRTDRPGLTSCPVCQKGISKNAPSCPHCGEPLKEAPPPPPEPTVHPSWTKKAPRQPVKIGCFGFLAIILAIGYIFSQCSGPPPSTTAPKKPVAATSKKPVELTRAEKIQRNFSGWDGSHIKLTRVIKAGMNDPKSYDHIRTTYVVQGDTLLVTTLFRGKNAFGGLIINKVVARVDLDGNVLDIISQGAP